MGMENEKDRSPDSTTKYTVPSAKREEEVGTGMTTPQDDSSSSVRAEVTDPVEISDLSQVERQNSNVHHYEPPDGGFFAWLQVSGSWWIYFNTWGLLASYGAFQSYYQNELLSSHSPFQISTIGSVQSFLMMGLGFFSGPIYDAGYFHHLLIFGSSLVFVGTLIQSFCSKFWQLMLVQGVIIGTGTGAVSLVGVAATGKWFTKKLPVATGTASLGSGVGGIVIPILFRTLQPRIGFGWAVRVLALLFGLSLGFSNLVMKTHLPTHPKPPTSRRKLIDKASFSDVPYLLFVSGGFLVFVGMYIPFFYVGEFSEDHSLAPDDKSPYILALLNFASIFGRVIPNFFTPATGALNMIILTTLSLAVSAFCFAAVRNLADLLIVTAIYGFWTGTFFSVQPTVLVRLTEDKRVVGTRIGFAFLVLSAGLLIGSPVAGALLKEYGYTSAWCWGGANLILSAGFFLWGGGYA
ncbi:major facilitator superfamily transporter [Zalerion maritima]|uniref:Major facilitator superfamily transporter n=1 Tax=Zalerion maritima TaxID=339359 RepID=A0AAD5RWA5_9PEZI|nr:major facilitator superfamily transporter [Zalerion maritima]